MFGVGQGAQVFYKAVVFARDRVMRAGLLHAREYTINRIECEREILMPVEVMISWGLIN